MNINFEQTDSAMLIVAHAQHPLDNGVTPGAEFRARLDAAAAIGASVAADEAQVALHFYVPGSQHNPDKRSLSAAGAEYLREIGVTAPIHGDRWNAVFGRGGVYNAADEVLVACAGAKALGTSAIVSVISSAQFSRMRLHYAAYGANPEYAVISSGQDAHDGNLERILTAYTHVDPKWVALGPLVRRSRLPR